MKQIYETLQPNLCQGCRVNKISIHVTLVAIKGLIKVVFDFRRAFPGLCSRNVVRPSLCRPTTPLATSTPKRKKTMLGYVPLRFQPLETWTHEVCVLARCDEDATPTRERLEELISAGLGKAKLVFPDKKADHNKVQLFLEEKFPKLKSAGGFEVLRASGGGGGQRPLSLLPPSKEGYSVPHLKERLRQAVAYIRPLQVDLDVTPNTVLEVNFHCVYMYMFAEIFSVSTSNTVKIVQLSDVKASSDEVNVIV